jgi:hypothetical protein
MMKHQWIFVGAVTALSSLGFAETLQDDYDAPTYEYEPEPDEYEAEPQYELLALPCIDCQCYSPIYLPLRGCDAFVSVDFLYWFAREKNLYYAIEGTMVSSGTDRSSTGAESFFSTFAPDKHKTLETGWGPGVRVGAGWSTDWNDWDSQVIWTYYHKEKKSSTSTAPFVFASKSTPILFDMPGPGQSALINPWTNQSALFTISATNPPSSTKMVFFPRIHAKWTLTLNTIDLDIGRTFWFRDCFTFRPYMGVRGAWTKTQFATKSIYLNTQTGTLGTTPVQTATDLTVKDRFTNRFWGVGIHLGIEPTWTFCCDWSIFADLNAALIYGQAKTTKKENYQGSVITLPSAADGFENHNHHSTLSDFSMQSIFDLALGIRWEQSWCCDRYHSEIDLSWEHHIWPENTFRITTFGWSDRLDNNIVNGARVGALPIGFEGQVSTLVYGGPVLRVRFDF